MLWNEWHACTNSRRPDISKVSDELHILHPSPFRSEGFSLGKVQRTLALVGRTELGMGWMEWGNENEHGDCVCFIFIFPNFPCRLCCGSS